MTAPTPALRDALRRYLAADAAWRAVPTGGDAYQLALSRDNERQILGLTAAQELPLLLAALSSAEAEAAALRASLTWALEHGARVLHGRPNLPFDSTLWYGAQYVGFAHDGTEEGKQNALLAALTQARQG